MRAAALLALVALGGCAHAPGATRPVLVRVEGWAPDDPADPDRSARLALADAQRRAVEAGAGLALAARTRVLDGRASASEIRAECAGRLVRWQALSHSRRDGLHRVRLRAWVLPGGPPGPAARLPDTRFALEVRGLDEADSRAAAAGLRRALLQRGAVFGREPAELRVELRAELASLGRLGGSGLMSYRARVSAEARRVRDGRVLAALSREAAAVDLAPALAGRKAIERAAFLAGEALAEAVSDS